MEVRDVVIDIIPDVDTDSHASITITVGNRAKYYGKWDDFTKKSEDELKEEEEETKRNEKVRLASIPDSEADKRDREKREALKDAKKQWDNVRNTMQTHSTC